MKYWEFLIQKEGDQTWQPLATQQLDIVAGRYRIMAHTNRINAPVEIRIAQLLTDDLSSQPKIRQRTDTTNESGLVLVMPYVNLQPGQWALMCSSLSADHPGSASEGGWQYGLKLQVFSEAEADGPIGWLAGTAMAHRSADSNGAASPLIHQDLLNKELPLAQARLHQHLQMTDADFAPAIELDSPSYRVSLRQQAYLAQQNQPMTIMGQVSALSEQRQEDISELWICLQDPLSAAVIMEAHRPLSLARLPADFKVQIQLPAEVTARLILGEVSLRAAAIAADSQTVLASTAFTITTGIDRQLEAIANQAASTFEAVSEFSTAATPPPIEQNGSHTGSDFVSIPALDPAQKPINPAIGVVLPPETDGNLSPSHPQPELPDFAAHRSAAESIPPKSRSFIVSQPAQFVGTSIENDDLEADEIAAVLEDIDQDLRLEDSNLDAFEPPEIDLSDDQPADADFGLPTTTPPQKNKSSQHRAKAHVAFQSLKLKDHFWQRLSALTHESHQEAAKIVRGMESAGISRERSANLPVTSEFSLDDEVVIYDDAPTAPQSSLPQAPSVPIAHRQASARQTFNTDQSVPPIQPAQAFSQSDQPEMALPVISVPVGDLIAGELITVTVRTRPSAYKPLIRLWMIDRQSRTLVTEPQTLTNLLPDALGDLQSTAQLQVPMDCLDVQIAAIAVDMATRQESGKAVVNRHVVPADQSSGKISFRL